MARPSRMTVPDVLHRASPIILLVQPLPSPALKHCQGGCISTPDRCAMDAPARCCVLCGAFWAASPRSVTEPCGNLEHSKSESTPGVLLKLGVTRTLSVIRH